MRIGVRQGRWQAAGEKRRDHAGQQELRRGG
jgi:hypothetical protein